MTTTRATVIREELLRMVRANPFFPFIIQMENGDRIQVNHPENVAFDPQPGGGVYFYAIGDKLRTFGSFDAVTNIVTLDRADI
jgi:hypothetical protein